MSSGRHVCIWFDDGDDLEVLCACGARAVVVVDDELGERVVVLLADEAVPVAA